MKTVKVMSIIGIVIFSFSLLCLLGFSNNIEDYEAAIGWGMIAVIYGIAYAIASLVSSMKHSKQTNNTNNKVELSSITEELERLGHLKENNVLSQEEYEVMKAKILKVMI